MLLRVIEMPGEERAVIRIAPVPSYDKILPPMVPGVAVRIGEGIGHVGLELLSPRLVAIDAGIDVAERGGPRGLDLRVHEGSLLEIERPARIEREAVGRVMRVGRVDAVEDADARVARVAAAESLRYMTSGVWATITPPL